MNNTYLRYNKIKDLRLVALLLLLGSLGLNAQTFSEALQYSNTQTLGTARYMAVGGAMAALGGDFSSISVNPAGIGVYRSSEFSFTPGFRLGQINSTDTDDAWTHDGNVGNVMLQSIGFVAHRRPLSGTWRSFNIGIGLNRVASFKRNIDFSGLTDASLTDRFLANADGFSDPNDLDPFESLLAVETETIFLVDTAAGIYSSDFVGLADRAHQGSYSLEQRGSVHDLNLNFSGNAKDKFMIGLSIGLPISHYKETKSLKEDDPSGTIPFFDEMEFTEELKSVGVGANVKFGMIYYIVNAVRVGGYIHSPTRMILTDNYKTSLSYQYTIDDDTQRLLGESPESDFEYTLVTPWRYGGGLAVVLKKRGFLSLDAEYVKFPKAKYDLVDLSGNSANQGTQDFLNNRIETELEDVLNLRAGAELVLDKFRIRAGATLSPDPRLSFDNTPLSLSGGFGYRSENFFVDLAYRYTSMENQSYQPYLLAANAEPSAPSLAYESVDHQMALTFGFRF